jgi:hypothetical protein
MGILEWAEQRTSAMTIWDVGVLKIYCVLFGVIVGAYISTFVKENLWWFVLSVLVFGLASSYRWLTAKAR